jgi:hypothetical protein
MPLECLGMSETAGEEHANLYIRGVNEAASGAELEAQEILDVLDVFGEDGVRMYLVGFLEGIEDRVEDEIEEYEMLEASVAFVVHESSVSILEESKDTLQVWVESAPKDLSTEIDLHIVDDEEEIVQGGRIVAVEFKDGEETSETAPTIVTVEKSPSLLPSPRASRSRGSLSCPCGGWSRKTGSQHHLWPHRSPGRSTCARQDEDRSPRGPRTSERCAYDLCYQAPHGLMNVTQVHSNARYLASPSVSRARNLDSECV